MSTHSVYEYAYAYLLIRIRIRIRIRIPAEHTTPLPLLRTLFGLPPPPCLVAPVGDVCSPPSAYVIRQRRIRHTSASPSGATSVHSRHIHSTYEEYN